MNLKDTYLHDGNQALIRNLRFDNGYLQYQSADENKQWTNVAEFPELVIPTAGIGLTNNSGVFNVIKDFYTLSTVNNTPIKNYFDPDNNATNNSNESWDLDTLTTIGSFTTTGGNGGSTHTSWIKTGTNKANGTADFPNFNEGFRIYIQQLDQYDPSSSNYAPYFKQTINTYAGKNYYRVNTSGGATTWTPWFEDLSAAKLLINQTIIGSTPIETQVTNFLNKYEGWFYRSDDYNPTKTTRLNYNGNFYATNLYSGGKIVATQDWVTSLGYLTSAALNDYVLKAGDTMTGDLTIKGYVMENSGQAISDEYKNVSANIILQSVDESGNNASSSTPAIIFQRGNLLGNDGSIDYKVYSKDGCLQIASNASDARATFQDKITFHYTDGITAPKFVKNQDSTNILLANGNDIAQSTFATASALGNYLPLAGGTMNSGKYIIFPGSANTDILTDSTNFAITPYKIQSAGNINIAANTNGSGTEYIILTSGYGKDNYEGNNKLNLGLTIGEDTLTWKGANVIAGTLGSTLTGKNYSLQKDGNNNLYVNVPWENDNTDTKVTQQKESTASTKYRSVLLGATEYNSNDTSVGNAVTDTSYIDNKLRYQPSTGTLYASHFYKENSKKILLADGTADYIIKNTNNNYVIHNGNDSDSEVPTSLVVYNAINEAFSANNALIFKGIYTATASSGSINTSNLANYGDVNSRLGWLWIVSVNNNVNGGAYGYFGSEKVEPGDLVISGDDNPGTTQSKYYIIQKNIDPSIYVTLTTEQTITGQKTFNSTNTIFNKNVQLNGQTDIASAQVGNLQVSGLTSFTQVAYGCTPDSTAANNELITAEWINTKLSAYQTSGNYLTQHQTLEQLNTKLTSYNDGQIRGIRGSILEVNGANVRTDANLNITDLYEGAYFINYISGGTHYPTTTGSALRMYRIPKNSSSSIVQSIWEFFAPHTSNTVYFRNSWGTDSNKSVVTTWNDWHEMFHTGNLSVSGGGSSWGSSITINLNGTPTTLTIPDNPSSLSTIYSGSITKDLINTSWVNGINLSTTTSIEVGCSYAINIKDEKTNYDNYYTGVFVYGGTSQVKDEIPLHSSIVSSGKNRVYAATDSGYIKFSSTDTSLTSHTLSIKITKLI